MLNQTSEAQAPKYDAKTGAGAATQAPAPEPEVATHNIQGNLIGFNKDNQNFLFFEIVDVDKFRLWLRDKVPFIATADEVLKFNRLFKEIKRRRKKETRAVCSTWINIAFSYRGMRLLANDAPALRSRVLQAGGEDFNDYQKAQSDDDFKAEKFRDNAFVEGMASRAVRQLHDPPSKRAEGNPARWVFGGPGKDADVVIIVASDLPDELEAETAWIESEIVGVKPIYRQQCAALPPPLVGREHFGFLDGVSQPGLRGRASVATKELITERENPADINNQGKPGQDLLWPGEFVFGYNEQNPIRNMSGKVLANNSPGKLSDGGPVWAKDGSFVVIRRLRQDVAAFHQFIKDVCKANPSLKPDLLMAKIVGRWQSGAPIIHQPDRDDKELGKDSLRNNDFKFGNDPDGLICPLAAHIRKVNPRDDSGGASGQVNIVTTQKHRMIRRGIPFGTPSSPGDARDSGDRGLMFVAYMTSIRRQFEFVQRQWANNKNFNVESMLSKKKNARAGHDLIIGQSSESNRKREFALPIGKGGKPIIITTEKEWVIATGGGYFFAPSIDALRLFSGAERG